MPKRPPVYQETIPPKLHPSITQDRIIEAVERSRSSLDNPGFCTACGADAEGCEPDARRYECEMCGSHAVYGAEELLMMAAWWNEEP